MVLLLKLEREEIGRFDDLLEYKVGFDVIFDITWLERLFLLRKLFLYILLYKPLLLILLLLLFLYMSILLFNLSLID